jgi:ABC-type glutathione transport system ATPase component
MHADRIYVLEKGMIVEEGSHEVLLEKKGLYYAMWRQQIGERVTVPRGDRNKERLVSERLENGDRDYNGSDH